MNDATTALIRVLRGTFAALDAFRIEEVRSRDWASATFTGVHHNVCFTIEGAGAEDAADRFVEGLEDTEFHLRGHFLADVALISLSKLRGPDGPLVKICLEALTMEDA